MKYDPFNNPSDDYLYSFFFFFLALTWVRGSTENPGLGEGRTHLTEGLARRDHFSTTPPDGLLGAASTGHAAWQLPLTHHRQSQPEAAAGGICTAPSQPLS